MEFQKFVPVTQRALLEEAALLLTNVQNDRARDLAERIRKKLRQLQTTKQP